MTGEDLPKRIEKLYERIDYLKMQSVSDPRQASEILSDTLEELESSLEELSAAEEELCQQNEELILTQSKLQESEEKYRELVENANSIIIKMDNTGKISFFNEYAQKFFGYSSEEILGQDVKVLIPPIESGSGRSLEEMADDIIRSPDDFIENINENVKRNGERVWVSWRNKAIRDARGDIIGNLAIGQDITERKRAEEALRKSEEKYHSLFTTMSEAFGLMDLIRNKDGRVIDYVFLDVNPAWERMSGIKREDAVGRNAKNLFGEVEDYWLDMFDRVNRTAEPKQLEDYGGGMSRYYNVIAWKVAEDRVAHTFTDITERKKADEVLKESEARAKVAKAIETERRRLYDVLETLPAYVCLLTPDYRMPFANWKFREWFGYDPDRKCHEFLFNRSQPCERCETYNILKTGGPHRWEWTGPNGRNYDIFDFPFIDADGSHLILEMGIDITEQKQAEEELKMAKEAAEAAVEAKAAFLANMSHELRTPMNAVIGFSSLLMDDELTPDQKDYLVRIRTSGEVLLSLINDILDFSKVEKNKVELEHRPMSLRALAEEALSMVAVGANDKGLNLALSMSYGTPDLIIGDHGRLRQVLMNLLSNAVKFTDHGGVTISISSKALGENKHQFNFAVKDTGIGIPADSLGKLFQPFSQVEATISSQRGGTGLGLAISKRLVELMGGSIWAESEPEKGSIFQFTIEAEIAQGKYANPESSPESATENLAKKKPMRILVAEDNPSNQKVMVEMLKRMGYMADVAADGIEVLQSLDHLPYDVIFMDVKMPRMDGLEATRQIRKRWPFGPKVVAITAYALEGDREKCIEAGMDDYIAKPVKKDDLAALLRNITPPSNKI